MTYMFLTADNGKILGPVAKVLGWIMDKIYLFLANVLHIENIALTIIVFTVFIYLCLFPLTYMQQKFSVLQRKMQPEIKVINEKYKGKTDQTSMMAKNEETQALYDKYGVSPTGSCVQLLIQMPILFALYRVFNNVPAYITSVKDILSSLAESITGIKGFEGKMTTIFESMGSRNLRVDFTVDDKESLFNYVIDVLYKLSDNGWNELKDAFPTLTDLITTTHDNLSSVNYLFVLNISDTPWNMIKDNFTAHHYGIMIAAFLIPLLSYGTQMLNLSMMPTSQTEGNDQMAQQMKMMNKLMPLMSLFFTFTVPVGLGLYWIMGAVVRVVQQFFLNKHFEKIDLDDIIEKNKERAKKKAEKRGERQAQIYNAATMNTKKSLSEKAKISGDKEEALNRAAELKKNAAPGSLAAKANKVKEFNENSSK